MSIYLKKIENNTAWEATFNNHFLKKRKYYVKIEPDNIILPGTFENCYEDIKKFEVRDDDVIILGRPKTGTRWIQEMAWLLLNDLNFAKAREEILELRSPVLEYKMVYDIANIDHSRLYSVLNSKDLRCYKSHLHWNLLPNSLINGAKHPKIIITLRGPEDTCTSYYHQCRSLLKYPGTLDSFCEFFLQERVPYAPYWKYVLEMWEQRHRANTMVVKFNRMKTDLAGTIQNVASFLNKELSENDVKRMCEHLTFDNLKKNKAFNLEEVMDMEGCNPFIRKGEVDEYKSVLSPAIIDEFRTQKEWNLTGTGLTFD